MYAKPIFDDKTRFALNSEGLHVVWPLIGDGVFGNWSLAAVAWNKRNVKSIIIKRAMTKTETGLFYSRPIIFWGALYQPISNKNGSRTAALVCFRWSRFGPPGGGPGDSGQKVFV